MSGVGGVSNASKMVDVPSVVESEGKDGQTAKMGQKQLQVVVTQSEQNKLADAVEELSAYIATVKDDKKELKEDRKKTSGKKKSEKKDGAEKGQRAEKTTETARVELANREKKEEDPFFKYRELSKQKQDLLQQLEAAGGNDTALKDKIASIDMEMQSLHQDYKSLIESGIAIDPAVQEAVGNFKSKSANIDEVDIHNNYREIGNSYLDSAEAGKGEPQDAVLDAGTLKTTFSKIVETYSEEYVEDGMQTLIASLAKDLEKFTQKLSDTPNVKSDSATDNEPTLHSVTGFGDKNHLRLILQDLYKLKNLHSLYLESKELFEKYTTKEMSLCFLIDKALNLHEKSWADTSDVDELTDLIDANPGSAKALSFLNRLDALFRFIPSDNAYSSGMDGVNEELIAAMEAAKDTKAKEENRRPNVSYGRGKA